jgi:hypothetical protein
LGKLSTRTICGGISSDLHEMVYQVVSQIAVTDSAKNSVIKLGAGPCDIIDLLLAC